MNSNQSKNLTQKQQELVKRLENIRNNRDSTSEQLKKPEQTRDSATAQRRNENTRQNRPAPTNTREKVEQKRTRTAKPSEFARPVVEPVVKAEPRIEYKPRIVQPRKRIQQPKVAAKKKKNAEHYINQLSDGKKLSQAIILSEILDKPVALRKR